MMCVWTIQQCHKNPLNTQVFTHKSSSAHTHIYIYLVAAIKYQMENNIKEERGTAKIA
jgi:hypothetical protein